MQDFKMGKTKIPEDIKKLTFEEALAELDEIVSNLEQGSNKLNLKADWFADSIPTPGLTTYFLFCYLSHYLRIRHRLLSYWIKNAEHYQNCTSG